MLNILIEMFLSEIEIPFFIYICDTRILKKIFINLYNMEGFWNYARQN